MFEVILIILIFNVAFILISIMKLLKKASNEVITGLNSIDERLSRIEKYFNDKAD